MKIDTQKLPRHIAIIMDGNGRWAKQRGLLSRVLGHRNAIKAVEEAVEGCAELGIEYLTLYTFSTENWHRPQEEIDALMELLVEAIADQTPRLMKNNIRLQSIGDIVSLPEKCQRDLAKATEKTSQNTGLTLVLALSYSSKKEILEATKKIASAVALGSLQPENISESHIENALQTTGFPDVDLMIRTGGDHRISNFMLWQIAYAELCFMDVFWPDFRREHLHEAVGEFQSRERRFGKTSEQISQ